MRVHSLVYIYRQLNEHSSEFTFRDKRGKNQQSRLDFFLINIETAAHTNKAMIHPITEPFDHSEIALDINFDKVMRGKGNWKQNNSHLKNKDFLSMIRNQLVLIVYEYQRETINPISILELKNLSPNDLQKLELTLNPQELMEQIHFILKKRLYCSQSK